MNRKDSRDREDSNGMEGQASIFQQASHWWVVLHSESASASDQHGFGEWALRSPERISAWLEVERLMRALKSNEVRWPDTSAEALIQEARSSHAEVISLSRRGSTERSRTSHHPAAALSRKGSFRIVFASGIAAAFLGAVAIGWFSLSHPHRYQTAFGEQYSVVLDDGSLVTLNTASKIEVDLQKNRRLIRLLGGEALFQVAQDKARPFEVVAGNTTVRAIGTKFNVDRHTAQTTVTVIEGKVAVSALSMSRSAKVSPEAPTSASVGARIAPIYLGAAERLVIKDKGSKAAAPERVGNLAAATAWTQRRLVFDHRPLGEVAAEFNRYNRRPIEVDSLELRRQEVTGVFQANDSQSFIAFLAKIPGVSVHEESDVVRVAAP